jgi:flagellar assembly protein FliH
MKYLSEVIGKIKELSEKQEEVKTLTFPEFSPNRPTPPSNSAPPEFQHLLALNAESQKLTPRESGLVEETWKSAEALKEKILNEARHRAELIEREAYEKGYHQGEVTGEKVAQKKFESALTSLDAAIKEMHRIKAEVFNSMEPFLVQLALAVARKIVHYEITLNPDVILQNIRAAMAELVHKDSVTVRLNPLDYQHISNHRELISGGVKNLVFETDPSVGRGGAILETDFGDLDARIDQQFSRIEHALKTLLRERRGGGGQNG